ncbi:Nephrocystin-3 [Oopsacas minuta]|uniref:Nephrocystin-3 n=1 Tax=Oopsacas minuta TaxID=111878 RepID=A0AAV7JTD7_9METZ|nr:Nephrocystin-3 [Oopsacas minuta]
MSGSSVSERLQSSVHQALSEEGAKSRTIRVFFSSPFGGMEGERETLTRKYFPEIASYCQSFGYDFIPIDLRWGITKEAADNAMVMWLCLKEIDNSDIFVGFYGMRYGWHDATGSDKLLDQNFEKAKDDYGWIMQYRHRSVTELEMRHGHLNKIGTIPSCFFFRNESFDTQKVIDLEVSGQKGEIRKYRAENDKANDLRRQLIREVKQKDSKQHLISMKDYDTPEDGATKIHFALMTYLKTILPNTVEPANTFKDIFLQRHVGFFASKLMKPFIGGNDIFTQLTLHAKGQAVIPVRFDSISVEDSMTSASYNSSEASSISYEEVGQKPIVLISGPGGGKSSVMCHWMKGFIRDHQNMIVFYHFVGTSAGSTNARIILMRMIMELYEGLEVQGQTEGFESAPDPEKLATKPIKDITKELGLVLKQIASHKRSALILLDGLHTLSLGKQGRPLSWLPKSYPKGVNLIVSISSKNPKLRRELVGKRRWHPLEIKSLDNDCQEEIINQVLTPRGKALSPYQTEMILSNKQCNNPLYLNIVLEEMVMFGDFFKLDAHMQDCLQAVNTKELFTKVIKRLSNDAQLILKRDDVLKQVMIGIHVSNNGLSEKEIRHNIKLDQREWSHIFFSLEKYLTANGVILNFAYSDLNEAVRDLYLPDPEDFSYAAKDLAESFLEILDPIVNPSEDKPIDKGRVARVASELPYLLSRTLTIPGQKEKLVNILSNIYIFNSLYTPSTKYDLIGYWNELGVSFEKKGKTMFDAYRESLEAFKQTNTATSGYSIVEICDDLASFLIDSGFYQFSEEFYIQAKEIQEEISSKDPNPDETLADILNKLGNFYVDTEQFEKAFEAQSRALCLREELANNAPDKETRDKYLSGMAMCYNGIAILCMRQKDYDKAVQNFETTLSYHKQALGEVHQLVADTYNNIGSCYYTHKQYVEAINAFNDALKVYNQVYSDSLPPDIGGVMTNLAMCYRYQNDFTQAENLYKEALRIREAALGRDHPDIAHTLMAIGLFEIQRENYSIAEEHFRRALEMFEAAYGKSHLLVAQAYDNLCRSLVLSQKVADAYNCFQSSMAIYKKRKVFNRSSIGLMYTFVEYHQSKDDFTTAYELLLDCIRHEERRDYHFVSIEAVYNKLEESNRPPRDATTTVDKGLELFPNSEALLIAKLDVCLQNKDVAIIAELLKSHNFPSTSYFLVFNACVQASMLEQGLSMLEQLIACDTSDQSKVRALKELSIGYHSLKQFDKASEYLELLCKLDPDNYTAKFNLGRLQILPPYNDFSRASILIEEALKIATNANDEDSINEFKVCLENLTALND